MTILQSMTPRNMGVLKQRKVKADEPRAKMQREQRPEPEKPEENAEQSNS